MSAALLERATRALRTSTDRASGAASAARLERALARLERAERARPRAPRLLRTTAWTLAATLAGAGAWAHATGRVSWFARVTEPVAPPAERVAPPLVGRAARTATRDEPEVEVVVPEVVVPEVAPPEVPAPLPAVVPPRAAARRVAAPKSPPVQQQSREVAGELYREAHAAHFTRGDYAAALVAWDRYLAAAGPAHRWTVEARFNRGVALFRLGQKEAARRALRPFAEGEYGSYRRDEAGRLLEALRSMP